MSEHNLGVDTETPAQSSQREFKQHRASGSQYALSSSPMYSRNTDGGSAFALKRMQ